MLKGKLTFKFIYKKNCSAESKGTSKFFDLDINYFGDFQFLGI